MFLSHSGNTAECVQVAEILRKREISVLAIVGKDGNGDIYVIVSAIVVIVIVIVVIVIVIVVIVIVIVVVIAIIVIVADRCYCCDRYCCYCYLNLFWHGGFSVFLISIAFTC